MRCSDRVVVPDGCSDQWLGDQTHVAARDRLQAGLETASVRLRMVGGRRAALERGFHAAVHGKGTELWSPEGVSHASY